MRATHVEPILVLVRRARARIRIQRMLDAACTALIPASGLALVGTHIAVAGVAGGIAMFALAGALLAGAIAVAAARPIPDEDVAARLDRACALEDRLRTALVFARIAPAITDDADTAAFMRAAIADGARVAAGPCADAVRATPFREPTNARAAALCTTLAALLACVGLPALGGDTVAPLREEAAPAATVDEVLPGDELEDRFGYPRSEVDDLVSFAIEHRQKELLEYGEHLRALLAALERGELTKEELLEKLAAAESRLARQLGQPANAALPGSLSARLADVHEAIARLETPRGKAELGDRRELDRTPDREDRLLALERRRWPPSSAGPPGTDPPRPPQGPSGKPRPLRPAGTPGPRPAPEPPRGSGTRPHSVHPGLPGGPHAGPTPGPGGVLGDGPAEGPSRRRAGSEGPLAARPSGTVGVEGTGDGAAPSRHGGGRHAGRDRADLVHARPAGTRDGATVVVHAAGVRDGAASTRATIIAAASQGFASAPYHTVFARYRRLLEETMHGEELPASYRYFVKRYFWKIRPETELGAGALGAIRAEPQGE